MSLYPLNLTVTPGAWRLFATRKVDLAFGKIRGKILERDGHTCQYCGFQARQHQEVVNLDHNYLNNKNSNLVTSCIFCAQCSFLDSVGKGVFGGGTLIYLPEVSQNELDGFCHVLFCAMANATNYQSDAQNIYRTFKLRAKLVEKHLGEGLSDPASIGQMLIDLPQKKDLGGVGEKIFKDLRLLPSRDKFNTQIADWAAAAMEELSE